MPGRRPEVLSRAPRQAEPVSHLSSSVCCSPARRPPALSPHMIEKITFLSSFCLPVQSARGHGLGRKTGLLSGVGPRLRSRMASPVRGVCGGVYRAVRSCVWAEAPVADLVFAPTLACCGGRWTSGGGWMPNTTGTPLVVISVPGRQPARRRAGLTSKPHHAQQPRVALRGSFCLRLASTCNHRPTGASRSQASVRRGGETVGPPAAMLVHGCPYVCATRFGPSQLVGRAFSARFGIFACFRPFWAPPVRLGRSLDVNQGLSAGLRGSRRNFCSIWAKKYAERDYLHQKGASAALAGGPGRARQLRDGTAGALGVITGGQGRARRRPAVVGPAPGWGQPANGPANSN